MGSDHLLAFSDIAGRDDDDATIMVFQALDRLDAPALCRLVVQIRLDVMDANDQEEAQAYLDKAICEAVALSVTARQAARADRGGRRPVGDGQPGSARVGAVDETETIDNEQNG